MFRYPMPYGPAGIFDAQVKEAIHFLGIDFEVLALPERKKIFSPEKTLCFAVLEQAVNDLLKYKSAVSRENKRLFANAWRYIFENHKTDWPFSFENICEIFHFQPQVMRKGIAKLLRASD